MFHMVMSSVRALIIVHCRVHCNVDLYVDCEH